MKGQTILRSFVGLLILALAGACSPASSGLAFEETLVDLGEFRGGATRQVVFAFTVGVGGAEITEFMPGCGCLAPQLEIGGEPVALPYRLREGAIGQVRVGFATAGFRGQKNTQVEIFGKGQGLPVALQIRSVLEPWFDVTPDRVLMGSFDSSQGSLAEVLVRGPEPFRLLEARGLHDLQVEGLPTPAEAREHRFFVRVPPDLEPGRRTEYLRIQSSLDLDLVLPIRFEPLGQLWVRPSGMLALGAFDPASVMPATIEVGVNSGSLPQPEFNLEGLPGASLEIVTLEPERSYRLSLVLPDNLPPGPVHGFVNLRLGPTETASQNPIQHRLRVVGLSKPKTSRP